MAVRKSLDDLEAKVVPLNDLLREELIARWSKIYNRPPPFGVRRELLIKAVAWQLQAKRQGGYSAETRRLLKAAVAGVERKLLRPSCTANDGESDTAAASNNAVNVLAPSPGPKLLPGARLLRDWNGRTHIVEVIENGFVFEAKLYRSLTAIALKITGAHWSGPRFFGIKGR